MKPWGYVGIGVVILLLVGGLVLWFPGSEEAPVPVEAPQEEIPQNTYRVIGKSVEGREIESFSYGSGDRHILFVGGIHGGYEWNSVLLAYAFIDYLDLHPEFIPEGFEISVIPALNPDGVYKTVGVEGRFSLLDIPLDDSNASGRFNAHGVDLNRNFACKWQPESMWRGQVVSAGTKAFSEPEAQALRDYVSEENVDAAVFWHSQSNAVYASECEEGVLPETLGIMDAYASRAGYPAVESFDFYKITGDAEGWLASVGIPAITVELKTHEDIEWEKNLEGISGLLEYYTEHE